MNENNNWDTIITARRVEAERRELELIKRKVCQWLSETLQMDIIPETFIETLDTGVVLCQLVKLVQEKARALEEADGELGYRIPLDPIKYHPDAGKATFHARENTKHFLDWCRKLGIQNDLIFETNGLVLHEDEKRVLLCLQEVSDYTKKVHIKPSDTISIEQGSSEADGGEEEMINPIVDEVASVEMKVDDDVSKVNDSTEHQPLQTNEQSGDLSLPHVNVSEGYFAVLDYRYYPFLFFFLLLLLLGGGLYFRRIK